VTHAYSLVSRQLMTLGCASHSGPQGGSYELQMSAYSLRAAYSRFALLPIYTTCSKCLEWYNPGNISSSPVKSGIWYTSIHQGNKFHYQDNSNKPTAYRDCQGAFT
jgi:hypothetical protein